MQKVLEDAARWYINQYNFTYEEMRQDLKKIIDRREEAFNSGKIENIYNAFACTEIVKAAMYLITDTDYPTAFSELELSKIRNVYKGRSLQQYYTCPKCGKEYPMYAFKNVTLYSDKYYCLACAKEIQNIYKRNQEINKGYVDNTGAIICAC